MKTLAILTTKAITHNRFLDSITNELKSNFKIILSCNDSNQIKGFSNLERLNINFPKDLYQLINIKNNFVIFNQIRKLINKVDSIYVHTPIAAYYLRFIIFFIRKKVKVIYHVHGLRYIPGEISFFGIFYRLIEFILSFKTDVFIVINKSDYSSISKFVNKNKVFFVKGVGINFPNNNEIKLIKKSNNFIIGVIGFFKKEKGFYQLLEIAKKASRIKDIKFFIYGDINLKKIKYINERYNLKNIKIKGFVSQIEKEIECFDIFLHPSHREGLNVSIQECLVRGIPVITTKARGCKDLIVEGYNGYTYDKYDLKTAFNHILTLYNMQSKELIKLKENCINYARVNLDRKNLSIEIKNIIISNV